MMWVEEVKVVEMEVLLAMDVMLEEEEAGKTVAKASAIPSASLVSLMLNFSSKWAAAP